MPPEHSSDECQVVMRLLRTKSIEDATRWMMTPHPELQDATPDAAIASGRGAEVMRIIEHEEMGPAAPTG
jgi:uncharacterized protein (DUF2384 family)